MFEKCVSYFTTSEYRDQFIQVFENQSKDLEEVMKWFLWFWHQELLHHSMKECLQIVYEHLFQQYPQYKNIDKQYTLIFRPSSHFSSRFSFYLGCDLHHYGWNLMGKVIEQKLYPSSSSKSIEPGFIHILYTLCECLSIEFQKDPQHMKTMSHLSTPQFIEHFHLEFNDENTWIIYSEFVKKISMYQIEIETELNYPNSLFSMIQQKYWTDFPKSEIHKPSIYSQLSSICQCKKIKCPPMNLIPLDIWSLFQNKTSRIPTFFLPFNSLSNQHSPNPIIYFDETTEFWSPLFPNQIHYCQRSYKNVFELFLSLLQKKYQIQMESHVNLDSDFFEPIFKEILSMNIIYNQIPYQLPLWIYDMMEYYNVSRFNSKLLQIWMDLSIQMTALQNHSSSLSKDRYISCIKLLYPLTYQKCKRLETNCVFPFLHFNLYETYPKNHWIHLIYPFLLRFFLSHIIHGELPTFYQILESSDFNLQQWLLYLYFFFDQDIQKTSLFIKDIFSHHEFHWKSYPNLKELKKDVFSYLKRYHGLIDLM